MVLSANKEAYLNRKNNSFEQPNPLHRFATYNSLFTLSGVTENELRDGSYLTNPVRNVVARSSGIGTERLDVDAGRGVFGIQEQELIRNTKGSGGGAGLARDRITGYVDKFSDTLEVLRRNHDVFIENVNILSTISPNAERNLSNFTKMEFEIHEPYSITLIEKIRSATFLSGFLDYQDAPLLLTIEFRGFDENGKPPPDLKEKYGRMILDADGFAQVFPEHKYLIVEALRQQGFAVGMTGDGVNDAPALKRADVGIAVSGATDAARAASDIVLTQPGLSVLIHAIFVARCIFQRVHNFINYRIAATLQLLIFFFITVFAFPPDEYYCVNEDVIFESEEGEQYVKPTGFVRVTCDNPDISSDFQNNLLVSSDGTRLDEGDYTFFNPDAVNSCLTDYEKGCDYEIKCPTFFQLPVILLLLITVLNDGTLISVGYDRAKPSPRPEKWNLRVLFTASAILGLVSMGSSLLLVWAALDSPSCGSLFREWGLPVPEYGQIVTMIYLKVSLSDFLTLFAARTSPGGFWTHRPGLILFGAAFLALGISTILGCLWPRGQIDGVQVQGLNVHDNTEERGYEIYNLWPLWIWIYCFVFFIVQDLLKTFSHWLKRRKTKRANLFAHMITS